MTVNVECPRCGKAYHVGDENIGAKAKCKNCGVRFTLSVPIAHAGKSESEEAPAGNAPQKAAADRSAPGKSSPGKAQGQRASSEAAPNDDDELMPKKLGHFVVQRQLGAGAMGVVYLAYDPDLDRQVAIKVLPAALSSDKESLERFLREARSPARLRYANVATVGQRAVETLSERGGTGVWEWCQWS